MEEESCCPNDRDHVSHNQKVCHALVLRCLGQSFNDRRSGCRKHCPCHFEMDQDSGGKPAPDSPQVLPPPSSTQSAPRVDRAGLSERSANSRDIVQCFELWNERARCLDCVSEFKRYPQHTATMDRVKRLPKPLGQFRELLERLRPSRRTKSCYALRCWAQVRKKTLDVSSCDKDVRI